MDYSGMEYCLLFRLTAGLSLEEGGRRSACAPGSAASGVTLWGTSLSSFCFLKAFMMRKFLAPISSMKLSTMSLVFLLEASLCGFSSPVALQIMLGWKQGQMLTSYTLFQHETV